MSQYERRSCVRKTAFGMCLALLVLSGTTASAVTNTWDGGSLVSAGWSQNANWVGDGLPAFGNTAVIEFYQAGASNLPTNFLETARTVRSLTFNSDADSAVALRLTTTFAGTTAANLTFDTDTAGGDAELNVLSGSTGALTLGIASGSVVLADNLLINHRGSGLLTLNRPITGAFGVTKAGTGALTVSGAATFTGPLTINGGTFTVGANNVIPDTVRVTVNAGGTFSLNSGGGTSDTIGSLAGAGSVTGKSGGTGSGMTLTVGADGTADALFSGVYQGDKARLAKTGVGKQILTGANTYDLKTVVVAGVDTHYSTIILQGTLQFGDGGSTGSVSSRSSITNNGTLAFNRSSTVRQGVDFGGLPIVGSGNLLKQGNGVLILTNANTYSGGTTVSAGTLLVNNATGSGTGAGGVTVEAGATLGGSGTIQGAVSAATGAALLPGDSTTAGTLTLQDSLTLNGNTLSFDLPSSGATDLIALTGAGAAGVLTLNGANTLKLNLLDGALSPGDYTLMTYASTNGTGTLSLDVNARNLALSVGATSVVLSVSGSGAGINLTWTGDGSGNAWDIGASALWDNGAGTDVFYDLDFVTFNDAGSATPSLDLTTSVQPVSVVVSNTASPYTFTGAGALAGSATLIKQGANTLTLAIANTFSGQTTVSGGTLSYGVSDALGSGAVTVSGAGSILALGAYSDTVGTVTLEGGGQITGTSGTLSTTGSFELKNGAVSAILAGSGALNKTTAATVTLSGSNTYSGVTTVGSVGVSNTILVVNHNQALGSTAAGTTILYGGAPSGTENRLVLGNSITVTDETLTLATASTLRTGLHYATASGTGRWDGNIVLSGGGAAYLQGIAAGGTLAIGGSSEDTVTGTAGSINLRGNGSVNVYSRMLIGTTGVGRNDAGTANLYTAGNTWGNTSVSQGTLRLHVDEALPATTPLSIGKTDSVGNAVLDLNGFNQTVGGLADLHFAGAGTQKITSPTPATLIINNTGAHKFGLTNSTIEGAVTLVKAGNGTLTLTGTNTYSGATVVSNGSLVVSSAGMLGLSSTNVIVAAGMLVLSNSVSIADAATVRIEVGAQVNLTDGVDETVAALYFGDSQKPAGRYSATGSGVDFTDAVHFTGSGVLTVLHGNGGTRLLLR